VFGLFRLLGYRFSPRLADVGGTRFWRIDPKADYGLLNPPLGTPHQLGYWAATEQKTRLRIQVTSTIEPDGLRSGRKWGMAMIRDRLGHITATQRLWSTQYHQGQSSPCLLAVAEEELGSYRGRAKARVDRQPWVQIEDSEIPVNEMVRRLISTLK